MNLRKTLSRCQETGNFTPLTPPFPLVSAPPSGLLGLLSGEIARPYVTAARVRLFFADWVFCSMEFDGWSWDLIWCKNTWAGKNFGINQPKPNISTLGPCNEAGKKHHVQLHLILHFQNLPQPPEAGTKALTLSTTDQDSEEIIKIPQNNQSQTELYPNQQPKLQTQPLHYSSNNKIRDRKLLITNQRMQMISPHSVTFRVQSVARIMWISATKHKCMSGLWEESEMIFQVWFMELSLLRCFFFTPHRIRSELHPPTSCNGEPQPAGKERTQAITLNLPPLPVWLEN